MVVEKYRATIHSRVAQWKRAGPITQRSVDRNHALLDIFALKCCLELVLVRWCSGYHVSFTRWRSPVRTWHGSLGFWSQFLCIQSIHVRMAEWSKAPDSRQKPCPFIGDKWRFLVLLWGRGFESPFWHRLLVRPSLQQLSKVYSFRESITCASVAQ